MKRGTFRDVSPLGCDPGGLEVDGLSYFELKREAGLFDGESKASKLTVAQQEFVGLLPRYRPSSRPRVVMAGGFDAELARFLRWIAERPNEHAELLADPELASADAEIRHRSNGKLPSMIESEAERRRGKAWTVRTYRSDG
jgi:hypothetical protein